MRVPDDFKRLWRIEAAIPGIVHYQVPPALSSSDGLILPATGQAHDLAFIFVGDASDDCLIQCEQTVLIRNHFKVLKGIEIRHFSAIVANKETVPRSLPVFEEKCLVFFPLCRDGLYKEKARLRGRRAVR